MLKLNQKVKTIPNPYCFYYQKHMPEEGNRIGRIIDTRDASESMDPNNPAIYAIDVSTNWFARNELRPIDDEPCDAEFLEEFEEMINAKSRTESSVR